MAEIIRNSLIYRALAATLTALRHWWSLGLFGRGIAAIKANYQLSKTRQIWLAWGNGESHISTSRYARFCHWLRHIFEVLGSWFKEGVIYRALQAISRGYQWLSHRSRILSFINKISLHQWFLVAFAMYLPLRYIIENLLGIALLSAAWEELFMMAAIIMVLWRRALQQTQALQRETPLDAWILLFFAIGFLLMALVQPYPAVVFDGYRIVVQYILWFFIIIRLVEDDRDMKVLYASFIIMSVFLALHGIYQYITAVEIPASWVSQTEMGVRTRVFSLSGSPNILGALMVMTAPLVAALIYFCKQTWAKVLFLGLLGCYLLTLLFTFSRGAWIGMIVAVTIFSLLVDKRLLALMGTAVAAVLAFVPSITSRLTYLFTEDYAVASAVGGRALRWATGQELLFENNPWLGFGLGRFGGAVAMNNQLLDQTETFRYFYMDNYYLKIMVEMGYLGIIFFVLMLAALLFLGIRAIQKSDTNFAALPGDPLTRAVGNYRIIAIGLFAGLCGVLAHCYFENIFEETYMTSYFWGLAALLFYLGFFRKKKSKSAVLR